MGSLHGQMNCGFVDGHVKALKRTTLMNAPTGTWGGKVKNRLYWDAQWH